MNKHQVMIIDSGAGGLSIASEIRKKLPNTPIAHIADDAHFPYGTKSKPELQHRIIKVCTAANKMLNPSVIVLGCNTASTQVLEELRALLTTPIIGVVPAIKPAAIDSANNVIGILATKGTVDQSYTHTLIKQFAADKTVVLHGSSILVDTIERWMRGVPIDMKNVEQELFQLLNKAPNMDTVVLACTHFPLIKNELTKLAPQINHWVDSGEAIARRTQHLLKPCSSHDGEHFPQPYKNLFFYTGAAFPYNTDRIENILGEANLMQLPIERS